MKTADATKFKDLITGVYAYHRADITPEIIRIWWNGCMRWDFDQIAQALNRITIDPEAGRFLPKIGDITRVLEGTHGDRAAIAWGKTLEAMQTVGAYSDVIFDDAAIHAVIDDMGGWPKLCRTELKELGFVQTAFCKSHRAYVGQGAFDYPRLIGGERGSDADYARRGLPPPRSALIGDPEKCKQVYAGGGAGGKTAVAFRDVTTLLEAGAGRDESDQQPRFRLEGRKS